MTLNGAKEIVRQYKNLMNEGLKLDYKYETTKEMGKEAKVERIQLTKEEYEALKKEEEEYINEVKAYESLV